VVRQFLNMIFLNSADKIRLMRLLIRNKPIIRDQQKKLQLWPIPLVN
jgi:hypothetical protein